MTSIICLGLCLIPAVLSALMYYEAGTHVWSRQTGNTIIGVPVVVMDNDIQTARIYFGSMDSFFYCCNAFDGTLEWTFQCDSAPYGSPIVIKSNVIFGCESGKILCLKNGYMQWSYLMSGIVYGGISYDGMSIYIASVGGDIVSLNPNNGKENWVYQTFDQLYTRPVVNNGLLYIGSGSDNKVYCIDTVHGTLVWQQHMQGAILTTIGLDADNYYIGDVKGTFQCYRRDTSFMLWEKKLRSGVVGSPVVYDEYIICGTEEGIYCIDKTFGNTLWYVHTDSPCTAPCTIGDYVLVGCENSKMYVIRRSNGEAFTYSIDTGEHGDGAIRTSPIYSDGFTYFGTHDGRMYCLSVGSGGAADNPDGGQHY